MEKDHLSPLPALAYLLTICFFGGCFDGLLVMGVMADHDIHDNVEENENNRGCLDSLQL